MRFLAVATSASAALYLLELLDLFLIGEIKRLAGVLRLVEDLVGLGLDDVRQALHHTHMCSLDVLGPA